MNECFGNTSVTKSPNEISLSISIDNNYMARCMYDFEVLVEAEIQSIEDKEFFTSEDAKEIDELNAMCNFINQIDGELQKKSLQDEYISIVYEHLFAMCRHVDFTKSNINITITNAIYDACADFIAKHGFEKLAKKIHNKLIDKV